MIKADQTGADQREHVQQLKAELLNTIKRSVYVYRIDCGGCNGCEIEIYASITPIFDVERFGIKVVPSPRHADILVYTGPMTRQMRLPALRAYRAAPDPKIIVAYGACGCSGGIFHDSYAVWGGAESLFPADVFIPGCPPTPYATIYGFATALGLLGQKIKGEHYCENFEDGERRPEDTAAPTPVLGVHPVLQKEIQRQARRLCGYWQGKRIAEHYIQLLVESPQNLERGLAAYLEKEGDPRLAEVYRIIHQTCQKWRDKNA